MRDFSKPYARFFGNPIKEFLPTTVAKASFENSVRLNDMGGRKIYLSLSDAIALALENNYDLPLPGTPEHADTDILRTKTAKAPWVCRRALVNKQLWADLLPS